MTNKLSLSQIEDSYELEDNSAVMAEWYDGDADELDLVPSLDREIDEACYRTSYQRKEIRTKRKREDGELVGKGSIHKHRKY
ncbi:MAG: hypothetical protein ACRC6V_14370 [Bacteroidales bacterium]